MIVRAGFWLLVAFPAIGFSQALRVHSSAHAHNDYEHVHPLFDALRNGFISVEADVWIPDLRVSHHRPGRMAKTLEDLYLRPLDSLINFKGAVYVGYGGPFYLMIDCKTAALPTYRAIRTVVAKYPALICTKEKCPVKIFLSGNRAVAEMVKEGYAGIAFDGRPEDLGKGYSVELMPVISDNYTNWSDWNGKSGPLGQRLERVRQLADRVHAEGKKLRLWAIPDNPLTWGALLEAGVDLISSDDLEGLNSFFLSRIQRD
jgi:hypothetical protein